MGWQAGEMLRSMIETKEESIETKSRILRGTWIPGATIQTYK
jgi:hypothetical protein